MKIFSKIKHQLPNNLFNRLKLKYQLPNNQLNRLKLKYLNKSFSKLNYLHRK